VNAFRINIGCRNEALRFTPARKSGETLQVVAETPPPGGKDRPSARFEIFIPKNQKSIENVIAFYSQKLSQSITFVLFHSSGTFPDSSFSLNVFSGWMNVTEAINTWD
jgi:hypothetical protein